jgi:hypothetical protein
LEETILREGYKRPNVSGPIEHASGILKKKRRRTGSCKPPGKHHEMAGTCIPSKAPAEQVATDLRAANIKSFRGGSQIDRYLKRTD